MEQEENKWKESEGERKFMNQDKYNQEFTQSHRRSVYLHRYHEERCGHPHVSSYHNQERQERNRKMSDFGPMRSHRGPGIRAISFEKKDRGCRRGYRSKRLEYLSRDQQLKGHRPHQHWPAEELTMQLLFEKRHLERRLARLRRRLHYVNRQLHAQIG